MSVFLLSCKSTKKIQATQPKTQAQNTEQTDSILFLTFNIYKDSLSGQTSVTLINSIKNAGKLKSTENAEIFGNHLSLYLFNNDKIYDSVLVTHPLYKQIEYPGDNGQLSSKDISLDKAEFFIRIQSHNYKTVKIYEYLNGRKTSLNTINLSQ